MAAVLMVVLVAFPLEMTQPSVAGPATDVVAAVFLAGICWLLFRAAFRTRFVARPDHFEVVNFLTTHHIPYGAVAEIHLDWLTLRLTLKSGRRVRAWALNESFLATRGERAQYLANRLGAITAERNGPEKPETRRTTFPDWWVVPVVLAICAGAITYRLYAARR
ncbi:hypothetical protein M1L60_40090 [Actinoplanes sp. TRM 88003]|uniref:PH domain-containing protein n=1 Tax=Paractinoplanes aksuensis TaxID=2939490 RepID=A0ABT1E111_9ACTN|nr:hypothetical protein [Actinoplanes aksuensis]MCO8276799.1 hypothetical protein [Actinoplanes aksuensis]